MAASSRRRGVFPDPAGWTMQNMLTVARLMIAAAITREESRGVHSRKDFPETDPTWAHHLDMGVARVLEDHVLARPGPD